MMKQFKLILLFIVVWRLTLFLVGLVADGFIPYHPTFPYVDTYLSVSLLPRWFYSWGNFDGVHYLTIAQKGYFGTGLIQAFFPLFPLLISVLINLKIPSLLASLLVSNLFLLGSAVTWIILFTKEFNKKIAWLSLIILLLFPSSFFLGAIYNESLFLFLTLQAFYWSKEKKWGLVCLFSILASSTRLVGIFLVPALLLENWQGLSLSYSFKNAKIWIKREYKNIILILLGGLGLVLYMSYLQLKFNDAFYFLHVQAEFGAGRQETLVLWPQVLWRYFKILITYQPHDWKFFAIVQELILSIFGLVGILLALKKIRWSYLIFALGAYVLPTLTGTFSSMPRYILVCFPLYLWLALVLEKHPRWQIAWLLTSGFLLVLNTMLFIQGYWVS
jgi:Gpi18-like mannosyltransferase